VFPICGPGIPVLEKQSFIARGGARISNLVPSGRYLGAAIAQSRFAADSLLEGAAFEPLVPVRQAKLTWSCRWKTGPGKAVARRREASVA
jgi:hypothetical protein